MYITRCPARCVAGLSPLLLQGQLVGCVQSHLLELLSAHLGATWPRQRSLRQHQLLQLLALSRAAQGAPPATSWLSLPAVGRWPLTLL